MNLWFCVSVVSAAYSIETSSLTALSAEFWNFEDFHDLRERGGFINSWFKMRNSRHYLNLESPTHFLITSHITSFQSEYLKCLDLKILSSIQILGTSMSSCFVE